jgi:hypothetical protein
LEILERGIERTEGARLADFDEGNFDHLRAELAEFGGKRSGLMAGAAY